MKSNSHQQQLQLVSFPYPINIIINSHQMVKMVSGFLLFAFGVIAGIFISTSYLNAIPPHLSFQSINFLSSPPLPSPLLLLAVPPPPPPSPPPAPPVPAPTPPPPPAEISNEANVQEPESSSIILMHDMTDEELLRRAREHHPSTIRRWRVPKVAFMFLVRGDMPFAPLWEKFFKGHHGLYSIYVHADPTYSAQPPHTSVFHARRIPSKAVKWGEMSMMEAERRLLANALLEQSNQRFVLLSEACIPLYGLPDIYSYLVNSTQSFVGVFDDPSASGRGRYNVRMRPQIQLEQWRKGSQWFEMDRELALEVVSDEVYFPVFKRHCRPSCYVDEHYIPTLVTVRSWGERNANRSLTWVDWSKGGPHPARINRPEVNPGLLTWMRSGGGECTYNGRTTTMCYLFARKFLPNSLVRLHLYAPKVLGFGW